MSEVPSKCGECEHLRLYPWDKSRRYCDKAKESIYTRSDQRPGWCPLEKEGEK